MAQPQTAKASPRKGKRIGPVSELSVFCKVKPGRGQVVRDTLDAPVEEQQPLINAVKDVGTLHNARYVLFDDDTRLLIATTFDGDWDVYIDDFAASYVLDAWDKFLRHCEGYPDEGKDAAGLTRGRGQGVSHRQPGHSGRTSTWTTPGLRRRRSSRRCAFRRPSSRCWTTPTPARRSSNPALKPLLEVAAD